MGVGVAVARWMGVWLSVLQTHCACSVEAAGICRQLDQGKKALEALKEYHRVEMWSTVHLYYMAEGPERTLIDFKLKHLRKYGTGGRCAVCACVVHLARVCCPGSLTRCLLPRVQHRIARKSSWIYV